MLLFGICLVLACPFDDTLREYLNAPFWLPFAKHSWHFEKRNVRRIFVPFAGMTKAEGGSPLEKLRSAYQTIANPDPYELSPEPFDPAPLRDAVTAARADRSLSLREREEVDLIDAKIDMRAGTPKDPELLRSAPKKLEASCAGPGMPPSLARPGVGSPISITYSGNKQLQARSTWMN
jgi:hypothetical protein